MKVYVCSRSLVVERSAVNRQVPSSNLGEGVFLLVAHSVTFIYQYIVTTFMSQKVRDAFKRVKEDIRATNKRIDRLESVISNLAETLEEFREREDELYKVEKQAEKIAELQQKLETFQS